MAPSVLRTVPGTTTAMLDVTSTNSTNTGSSSIVTLNDRLNLIASTTLVGVFYGIMTALYCMTLYSLLKKFFRRSLRSGAHPSSLLRSKMEWRRTLFYIVYTSTLFVLATVYTAGTSQNAVIAYVDNRLYPGGPYLYFVTFMASQPAMIMTDVASLIVLWMTDGLILCRFIVFYYKVPYARWIIPLPCVMYVGVIVLSTFVLKAEAGLGEIFYLSENLLMGYYALSFSMNVLSTVLIAARLYWHKIQLQRVFASRIDSPYMNLATLLIESAALYGTWSLAFLILCVLQSSGQDIILATVTQIQVIAPLLIILWIARGTAWSNAQSSSVGQDSELSNPISSHRAERFSFGARPTRVAGELGVDADGRPSTSRNASWSSVTEVEGDEQRDIDIGLIELGRCECKRPSVDIEGT